MSAATFADLLTPLLPFLPSTLVPAEARSSLLAVAQTLPVRAGTHVLFEVRLAPGGTRNVDLSVNLALDRANAEEIAGHSATRDAHALAVAAGAGGAGVERERLPTVWLELDAPGPGARPPAPAIFVRQHAPTAAQVAALLGQAARQLPDAGVDESIRAAVQRAIAARPEDVDLVYVGFMPGRMPPLVRLEFSPPRLNDVVRVCRAIGWPGDFARLDAALGLGARVERLLLGVDVRTAVEPRLGLELHTGGVFRARPGTPLWGLLDALVAEGLVTVEAREALLDWLGHGPVELPIAPWRWVAFRTVNHVKLTVGADGRLEAKGYLLCRLRPAEEVAAAALGRG